MDDGLEGGVIYDVIGLYGFWLVLLIVWKIKRFIKKEVRIWILIEIILNVCVKYFNILEICNK